MTVNQTIIASLVVVCIAGFWIYSQNRQYAADAYNNDLNNW